MSTVGDLRDHARSITALGWRAWREGMLLASASADKVVVRTFTFTGDSDSGESGQPGWRGSEGGAHVVADLSGHAQPRCCVFDSSGGLLALGCGREVHIYTVADSARISALSGHLAPVNCVCFGDGGALGEAHRIVSAGDDRMVKVWDLASQVLLWSSGVLCAATLQSLTLYASADAGATRIAVGTGDGRLLLHELADTWQAARELDVLDLAREVQRIEAADNPPSSNKSPVAPRVAAADGATIVSERASRAPSAPALPEAVGAAQCEVLCVAAVQRRDGSGLGGAGDSHSASGAAVASFFDDGDAPAPADDAPLSKAPLLVAVTTAHCIVLDARSHAIVSAPLLCSLGPGGGGAPIGVAAAAAVAPCASGGGHAVVAAALTSGASVFDVEHAIPSGGGGHAGRGGGGGGAGQASVGVGAAAGGAGRRHYAGRSRAESASSGVTLRASGQLAASSPLYDATTDHNEGSSAGAGSKDGARRTRGRGKRPAAADKPVTFHSRIKSSGYGAEPPRKLFGADRRKPSAKQLARSKAAKARRRAAGHAALLAGYPMAAPPPTRPLHDSGGGLGGAVALHESAVARVAFSGGGAALATASADGSACTLRLRGAPGEAKVPLHSSISSFVGHRGRVLDVAWSHGRVHGQVSSARPRGDSGRSTRKAKETASEGHTLILTGGDDRTARMWLASSSQPVLVFRGARRNASGGGVKLGSAAAGATPPARRAQGAAPANPELGSPVEAVSFFYRDRFVLVVEGNNLRLYSYELDGLDDADDLRRLANHSSYRLRWHYEAPCKSITAMAAANAYLSHTVLLGGSDRSVYAVDVAAGALAQTFADVHPRPPHTVAIPEASTHASLPAAAHDTMLTSALDGAIHVWDLRAGGGAGASARLTGHANRSYRVRAAFSPCMRWIASGSEDKCAYLYDLRRTTLCSRLRGAADAVSDVAFSPTSPLLAAASLDGCVRLYEPAPASP